MLPIIKFFIISIFLFGSLLFAKAQPNNKAKGVAKISQTNSCEKRLRNGVSYVSEDPSGKETKIRLRFAPYVLTSAQTKEFSKFRANFEKLYGQENGAKVYEKLVCRYFFGSYNYINLPEGADVVNKLLQECPLKTLTDILLADGPRPDCAPGVVHCRPYKNNQSEHPLDKIPCARTN